MGHVVGCDLAHSQGELHNYRRHKILGEPYPGLYECEGERVEGVVYHNIPDNGWERLDRFEGEMYQRRLVTVRLLNGSTTAAAAYIVKHQFKHRLDSEEWDYNEFLQKGKAQFVAHYRGYDTLG